MSSPATTYPSIRISPNAPKKESPKSKGAKPDHWADAAGTSFINPWPSWRFATTWERVKLIKEAIAFKTPEPKRVEQELPIKAPNWGNESGSTTATTKNGVAPSAGGENQVKATWLGHACFLVEFPLRNSGKGAGHKRGLRILFDPVFSNRCSPSQLVGPKRFTPPPCKIEEIPEFDAVVISHDHYDHLDTHTIRSLASRASAPHFFAALGNAPFFASLGIPESRTHIMDWWESKRLEIQPPAGSSDSDKPAPLAVDITCTPAQHFSGRTLSAYYTTLWASWSVEEVTQTQAVDSPEERPPVKVFFGGDTGYRSVMDHQNEDEVPVCPAFKEIGEVFGGFDLAMLPIGAYLPRQFMSPIHCAPQDSVRIFKDIKAKKAVGMHWGTWVLTSEDGLEPPKRLREECRKLEIGDDDFVVCDIGETLFF